MDAAGLSQARLAKLVGCSRSEVNKMLKGKRSGVELGATWDTIAALCGVPPEAICYVVA